MAFSLRARMASVASGALALALVAGAAAPAASANIDPAQGLAPISTDLAADTTCDVPGARFTLGILPDTQFHSRYATEESGDQFAALYGSEPFTSQTSWLVNNAAAYDISGVLHLGDIVDQAGKTQQWEVADAAMAVLENGKLPYSILAGNHDVTDGGTNYFATFPVSRAQSQAYADGTTTFAGASPDGMIEAHNFVVDGQKIMSLAVSWEATDADFAWAKTFLAANPDTPTIVTTHQILDVEADGVTPIETAFGDKVWAELVTNFDQVFLTYSGHHHGALVREQNNAAGHPVVQVLIDYQMAYMGGNGLMALTEFDLTNNKISQTSFSPWVIEKPAATLTSYDQAILDDANQSWTLDFDFATRFPNLVKGELDASCYTAKLRNMINAAYVAPEAIRLTEPTSSDDFPVVDGTVAHWRMAGTGTADGAVLPVGTTITDVVNGNTMTRGEGTGVWTPGDVTYTTSHNPLSSDEGAVCFDGAGRRTGPDGNTDTANFFATAADAAANAETFPNGYTFETFIKIDPKYNADDHRWMAWLSPDGQRTALPGYVDEGDGGEPPFSWAFSNLREIQFAYADAKNPPVEGSTWSGEIVSSDWMHVAVVNDPATQAVTMYINGEPVLRNETNSVGMATQGLPWVIGAGSYEGTRQSGFVGCIGETRLVDHPIERTSWLTARAPIVAEPTEEPTTVAPTTDAPTTAVPTTTAPTTTAPTVDTTTPAAPSDNVSDDATPIVANDDLANTGSVVKTIGIAAIVLLALGGILLMVRARAKD